MITLRFSSLSPDLIKMAILFFVVGILMMVFMKGIKKLFSKKKKQLIVYILVIAAFFALTALLSNENVLNNIPLHTFIAFQIVFLLLGILHVYVCRQYFELLSEKPNSFWSEFIFTIAVNCIALIGFAFIVNMFKPEYVFHFLGAAIWFLVPILVIKTYEFATSIPLPVYKKWFYPIGKHIKDPKDEELINPQVISFEFHKDEKTSELSNFRLKAPEKMAFGKLFYFFINDYNDRHPENKIVYINSENEPHGWVFYRKPKWYLGMKYIDYARTVDSNGIKEDNVIICQRVD
ncbi:TssN family type VI secretion system protein [uncultured Marixanthomonas sp.]|uniref:TssN family type VI secretion system protein n=1 Tax=uncultured Marixanthomonas sp. TaxID=757245 RepID=UPI0030DB9936|tara:strand:+ start:21573 stop:22445 length:873 start_codon:yes stop_codon:yes gene_type:complete